MISVWWGLILVVNDCAWLCFETSLYTWIKGHMTISRIGMQSLPKLSIQSTIKITTFDKLQVLYFVDFVLLDSLPYSE